MSKRNIAPKALSLAYFGLLICVFTSECIFAMAPWLHGGAITAERRNMNHKCSCRIAAMVVACASLELYALSLNAPSLEQSIVHVFP